MSVLSLVFLNGVLITLGVVGAFVVWGRMKEMNAEIAYLRATVGQVQDFTARIQQEVDNLRSNPTL